jgi:transcriptional regulator with XRE-family HTH domain
MFPVFHLTTKIPGRKVRKIQVSTVRFYAYRHGSLALAPRTQLMATTLATIESREVLRCERCQLVQFRTSNGDCRRCHKPLEIDEPALPAMHPRSIQDNAPQELDVARAVRTLRNARALSQRQLAGRMGVPRTYISKIENGKAVPTLSSLERLASALEAPLAELVHDARSRREQVLTSILADDFLNELLPMICRLDSFQQQVVLSHARDMAREAVSGRPRLARA